MTRIKNSTRFIAICLVMAMVVSFSAGCDPKKAATAMKDFSDGLEAVQAGFEAAHKDGFQSDADYQATQVVIGKLSTGGIDITTALKAGQKQAALARFNTALGLVDQLSKDGVAGVKNDDQKLALSALILSLRGIVTTAEAFAQ